MFVFCFAVHSRNLIILNFCKEKNILSSNNWIPWVSKFGGEKIRTGDKVNVYIAEMKKIREVQLFFLFALRQPDTSGKFIFLLSFRALLTSSLIAALKRL